MTDTLEIASSVGLHVPMNTIETEWISKLQAFREAVEAESDAERMKQPAVGTLGWNGKTVMMYAHNREAVKKLPAGKYDLYAQPFPSTEQLQQRVKELADALRDIAKQDPVEMALDPQWAARVARITLTACGDVAS